MGIIPSDRASCNLAIIFLSVLLGGCHALTSQHLFNAQSANHRYAGLSFPHQLEQVKIGDAQSSLKKKKASSKKNMYDSSQWRKDTISAWFYNATWLEVIIIWNPDLSDVTIKTRLDGLTIQKWQQITSRVRISESIIYFTINGSGQATIPPLFHIYSLATINGYFNTETGESKLSANGYWQEQLVKES